MVHLRYALLAVLAATTVFAQAPRPISGAEGTALRFVAHYLDTSQLDFDHVAYGSPLRRVDRKDILTTLGPADGATWELHTVASGLAESTAVFEVTYASGLDETVIFQFVEENGETKINDIRGRFTYGQALQKLPPQPAAPPPATGHTRQLVPALIAATFLVAGVILFRWSKIAAGVLVVLCVATALLAWRLAAKHEQPVVVQRPETNPRALASLLSSAAYDLQSLHLERADATLARVPYAEIPLVPLLRGRIAAVRGRDTEAVVEYEHALQLLPDSDALRIEAAEAVASLEYEDRGRDYLKHCADIGSRDAGVYYRMAMLYVLNGQLDSADAALHVAWQLEPISRERLAGLGILSWLYHHPRNAQELGFCDIDEPLVRDPVLPRTPLPEFARADVVTVGSALHAIFQNGARLDVPGGARFADEKAAITGLDWERREEERALAEVEDVRRLAAVPGAFYHPAGRRRLERTIIALADRNRWNDVVELTNGISPTVEAASPWILMLRYRALRQMRHYAEAKQLLIELSGSPAVRKYRDPSVMTQLGELFASQDLYEPAVRLLDRADRAHPTDAMDDRIRQIRTDQRLSQKYATLTTAHFELRFPDESHRVSATELSQFFEDAYARLTPLFPGVTFEPIKVNVVWWEEFRSIYTGSDMILGFFRGSITIPYAGVPSPLPAGLEETIDHETLHALLAQATNDQAPSWFHEGLAQRIELKQFSDNPYTMLTPAQYLPVSLLDAVLTRSNDIDSIETAYLEAETAVHFIEARYGKTGIAKMITAFRRGATTEEALQAATGSRSIERELRAWALAQPPSIPNDKPLAPPATPRKWAM